MGESVYSTTLLACQVYLLVNLLSHCIQANGFSRVSGEQISKVSIHRTVPHTCPLMTLEVL